MADKEPHHLLAEAIGGILDGLPSDVVLAVLEAFTSSCLSQISQETGEATEALIEAHAERLRAVMVRFGTQGVQN